MPFALSHRGNSVLAEPLGSALRAQWAYGFPTVPKPCSQLTHGFFQYPAGMQAVAAMHMLDVLPDGVLLDPFVGAGTTVIEAMRSGRETIGADVSPLALFASSHHTWIASDDDLCELRTKATEALQQCDETFVPHHQTAGDGGSPREKPRLDRGGSGKVFFKAWEPLKAEVERLTAQFEGSSGALSNDKSPGRSSLWFCYAAAQQRSARFRFSSPLQSFDATVDSYCSSLRSLRSTIAAELPAPRLLRCDVRELSLTAEGLPLADAVLTSPPYAGVYDYMSHAREERARLAATSSSHLMGLKGTPMGRDWPITWRSASEIGARKQMKKALARGAFEATWDADQHAWLSSTRANLRLGGRAALLIGDGEGGIDALESTVLAAKRVGLQLLASATIQSSLEDQAVRHKGRRRPEHAVLLEAVEA
jgi:hypothetical protein